jgi:hypothetical protein
MVYKLLLDCIGQLHGHKPGDLYYSLGIDYDSSQNTISPSNNIALFNLDTHGMTAKTLSDNTYEFKTDISKTIDFSNVYEIA